MKPTSISKIGATGTTTRREFLAGTAGFAAALAVPSAAIAQDYPTKPITIITGFAPGGPADLIGRVVGSVLEKGLGQPTIVEAKTGASGNVSVEYVARAEPDGYTLLFSSIPAIVINPHTYPSLPVNPVKDLVHISMICEGDFILAVPAQLGVNTWDEFVALVKANPGRYNYGTSGAGGNSHVYSEAIKLQTGMDLKAVHYRGSALQIPDLLTNQIQMVITNYPALSEHIAAGTVKPLLIVGKSKDPNVPDVPTATEAGLKDFDRSMNWLGLHAPKGTPKEIVDKIYAQIEAALKTEEYRNQIRERGLEATESTPEEFTARINSDYEFFGEVVKAAGVKVE